MKQYKIAMLIGDPEFMEDFKREEKRLSLEGYIIIPSYPCDDTDQPWWLMDMPFHKVNMCDIIFVIKGNNINPWMEREIQFAECTGKEIIYINKDKVPNKVDVDTNFIYTTDEKTYCVPYIKLTKYIGKDPNVIFPSTINGLPVIIDASSDGLWDDPAIPRRVTFEDGVRFKDNSMENIMLGCVNLMSVNNIPESVTDMSSTFSFCTNLTTAPVIPNSVINMSYTFSGCRNLTTAPVIPNGVISIPNTFRDCINLTTAPVIPESVTDMSGTFRGCDNLTVAPIIPNKVTDVRWIFFDCKNLKGNMVILSPNIQMACSMISYAIKNALTIYVPVNTVTHKKISIANPFANINPYSFV